MRLLYKATNKKGNVRYFRSLKFLSRSLAIGYQTACLALNNGETANGFYIEKLEEPIEQPESKIGETVEIEGIKCKVINVYDNTMSVSTPFGTRLVRLNDMFFVGNGVSDYDRNRPFEIKNFA